MVCVSTRLEQLQILTLLILLSQSTRTIPQQHGQNQTTGNLLRTDGTVGVGGSWAATGTTTPVAFTNLSGKLGVQAYLNQRSAFDLTNTVQLDGLSTLELVYLP